MPASTKRMKNKDKIVHTDRDSRTVNAHVLGESRPHDSASPAEKPVSLTPLGFEDALRGLLATGRSQKGRQ